MQDEVISQYSKGFVSHKDSILYVRDDDMNIIDEYLFDEIIGLTLNGLAVSNKGTILNIQTGEKIKGVVGASVSEYRDYVTVNGLILVDGEWENNLDVFCQDNFVNFFNGKLFKSNLDNNFIHYIYKNHKSILIYEDHVKVYDGELYSVERFDDLLHSDGFFDDDYSELIGIYNVDFESLKIYPDYLMFGDNIFDIINNDMYQYTCYPIGIKDGYVIDFNGKTPYKYLPNKIKNVV